MENGDILLEKTIINTNGFTIIHKENGDILLEKIKCITITKLEDITSDYNFNFSNILNCNINNINITKLKYKTICKYIYNIINDGSIIIKKTKLNIKTIIKTDNGFIYYSNLGISVQGADCNSCIKEIINQCIENNITIKMEIKTKNNLFIHVNIMD